MYPDNTAIKLTSAASCAFCLSSQSSLCAVYSNVESQEPKRK